MLVGWQREAKGSYVDIFSDMCMLKTVLLVLAGHQLLFTAFQGYVGGTGRGLESEFQIHTHRSEI